MGRRARPRSCPRFARHDPVSARSRPREVDVPARRSRLPPDGCERNRGKAGPRLNGLIMMLLNNTPALLLKPGKAFRRMVLGDDVGSSRSTSGITHRYRTFV